MNAISTRKVVKNYKHALFSKSSIRAKIKAHYKDPKLSQNLNIKLRINKDEVIWMSGTFLGFSVVKVKITPTRVQYYEKIKKTYFDGDFSILSSILGTEINFNQLQNLLIGQSLVDLDKNFINEIDGKSFKLTPKKQQTLFDVFFWINPQHHKIDKQQLNSRKSQSLTINYPNYQQIKGEFFPQNISITAIEPKQTTQIDLIYKNVTFDEQLSFPFKIPANYKKINLKKNN